MKLFELIHSATIIILLLTTLLGVLKGIHFAFQEEIARAYISFGIGLLSYVSYRKWK